MSEPLLPRASLARRGAALFYDTLLVLPVLGLATVPALILGGGTAIPPGYPPYQAYLLMVGFIYFGWFWTHGGQTLGMRAWRLRLCGRDGSPVTWRQSLMRFLGAILSLLPLGAGYLWILVDREGLAWHDRLSNTLPILDTSRSG